MFFNIVWRCLCDPGTYQHGVKTKIDGPANIRLKLVADHNHVHGTGAAKSLLEDRGMGFAESLKAQIRTAGISPLPAVS